jgi:putative phosphoesterase
VGGLPAASDRESAASTRTPIAAPRASDAKRVIRLLIVSDTHVPTRARVLPDELWHAVAQADVVVHAGDWTSAHLHRELAARARSLVAVYGNNDGPDLRAVLPEVARETLAGVRLTVVHETGGRAGREERMAALYADTDVLVFGHSHIPWDTTASTGLRLLNPGSPTDRRRQPYCTYMTATAADGFLLDVVLHSVPRR